MAEKTIYTLEDTTIAQIARCLQVAILTGTDIADNLRQLELELKEDSKLGVTDNYQKVFNDNIDKLLNQAEETNNNDQQLKLF
tara:strand:+ start:158 stop:406 length:249 start_codon:yes stop_codon:yes gene_type:complete